MKKIIIITICLIALFGIWQNVFAVELLIKEYPAVGVDGKTLSETSSIPELIRYIYLFSLGIVGFTALLSILIGAVRYITAGTNASLVEDAKYQIKQALLGILILLAAVLILNTINPDLVNLGFTLPKITGADGGGRTQWYCYACCNQSVTLCNLNGSLTGCKSLGAMTGNEARTLCEDLAKKQCNWSSWGYNSQASAAPCP